jgi:hypothetical protein
MVYETLTDAIRHPKARVFRRAYVRRRLATTGLFEDEWQEITKDVMSWGSIRSTADETQYGRLTLEGMNLKMTNNEGRYNPQDDPSSLWFGYANIQRSLLKIEAGFIGSTQGSTAFWMNPEFPGRATWDDPSSFWDIETWDSENTVFVGIIAGEMAVSDDNTVTLNAKPLTQIFKDFPARNLVGWNSSLTASGFMQMLRDQTDGSGSFIFRPFFGDTTTNWEISATSNVYSSLVTGTASDVIDKTAWDIVEKMAVAEDRIAFISPTGVFKFISKTATSAIAFHFHGNGSFDTEYGHTIKKIQKFGKNFNNYYSAVQVKFREDDTATSYVSLDSAMVVSGSNNVWNLGARTFSLDNKWIPNTTVAQTIANTIYSALSTLQDRLEFTTSFVPHLTLLDRVAVSYDSTTRARAEELWDANDWDTELEWDSSRGNAIILDAAEFKFLSMEINLDSLENRFVGRRI